MHPLRVPAGVPTGGQFTASARGEAAVALDSGSPAVMADHPPLVEFDEVAHVGTLSPADRQAWSYEGEGLSVSVHPDEWDSIARLGGTEQWSLRRRDGEPLRFVSWHDLDPDERDRLREWARDQGWIEQRSVYRITFTGMDDDGMPCREVIECADMTEAEDEADAREVDWADPATTQEIVGVWRPTPAFPEGRISPDADPGDMVLAAYVRAHRPDLDGVWWADEYAPERLSCPRGVIVADLERYDRAPR